MENMRHLISLAFRSAWLSVREILNQFSARLPFWLHPGFWASIFAYPFRLFFAAWHLGRWRSLFFGTPAVLSFLMLILLNQLEWYSNLTIADRYMKLAEASFENDDFVTAEMLLNRVMREMQGKNSEDIQIRLAEIYQKSGQTERAEFLFSAMAPDDGYGRNPRAHRGVAIPLCARLTPSSSRAELNRALHHLKASRADGDVSPEMLLAWARYSIAVGELDPARDYLERVVTVYPEVERNLGTIYLKQGDRRKALSSFAKAKAYLAEKLNRDPKSRNVREDYVSVLIQMGEINEARMVLETGMELTPDGNWHVMLAELYVIIHDVMAMEGGHSVSELFIPLARSLEQDPNTPQALNRLMSYVNADVQGNVELRSLLSRVVAEGKEPALAHLALGNICWVENDPDAALFHFEHSVAINPKLSVVLNNLAWLLADKEGGQDLDRALALANAALAQNPAFPRFLDTRGTVLMKMGRWNEAVADLESALNGAANPAEVHEKLSEVYNQLNHPVIAQQHLELAQEIRSKPRPVAD